MRDRKNKTKNKRKIEKSKNIAKNKIKSDRLLCFNLMFSCTVGALWEWWQFECDAVRCHGIGGLLFVLFWICGLGDVLIYALWSTAECLLDRVSASPY